MTLESDPECLDRDGLGRNREDEDDLVSISIPCKIWDASLVLLKGNNSVFLKCFLSDLRETRKL